VLRPILVGPLVTRLAVRRLFKALKFLLACAAGSFTQCAPPPATMATSAGASRFEPPPAVRVHHYHHRRPPQLPVPLPGPNHARPHRSVGRSGRRRQAPPRASPPVVPTPNFGPNRSLENPSPSPALPRPDPGEPSPEFRPDRRRPPRGTQLRVASYFQGSICKARTYS
jgi:hypothetical protein